MPYRQDIAGCLADAVGQRGVTAGELDAVLARAKPALATLTRRHDDGSLPLLRLPARRAGPRPEALIGQRAQRLPAEARPAGAEQHDMVEAAAQLPGRVGERAEIGDRSQDSVHHRFRVAERDLVTQARLPLIVVDGSFDLRSHFGQLAIRLQSAALDPRDRVVTDHVIGVRPRRHRRAQLIA